ncbi:hypothetical protein DTO006G1_8652 [Penicillium roqueforti]|uniref:uncharacterized protein n=1 Tax=Penicillium roqueforti TaxID=5082 RepID=UPI00190E5620|nr:uncharacterized protein LCP9604111_5842 [Penicillium roqueforti]KAF9248133.1 hypothetical protein LCP9604111_5842 [Penicillium roqueforti]KAI1830225.1 hypothetical protein CBS147337_9010 [Penicillium roqueforti]KAI2672074.1 hypothetical protein CBS147355_8226 [Penicillium roqueforti]KAI2692501.1 hypothetical protein LCP963914a_595 [Penicillium roqueforti]KAI2705447.1 hypothetical protein CBS147372_1750 [Penicillium roqueforti]
MALFIPMSLVPLCFPTPPTPKTEFQTLPAEIKLLIIDQLDRDTYTLSHLAACNRELYNMAIPALYANVSLGAVPHYRMWPGLAFPADRRSIERFLITILRKPHLAEFVKSLDVTDLHDLCFEHRQSSTQRRQLLLNPLAPQDHQMIMDAAMKLPLYSTIRVAMRKALGCDVPRSDAMVAVLLGYLPALKHLEIAMESEDPFREPQTTELNLIERVLISIAGARSAQTDENGISNALTPTLSKLTHLKAEVDGKSPMADIDWLMMLLRIPTLTHVFGTKWSNAQRWLRPVPGSSHRLVHLELRDCTFDALNLRRLLRQTHILETFIYERGWTEAKDWVVKAADLSQALQYRSHTLTCLELSFNRTDRKIHEELYLHPLNLSGLSHLKRLRISAGYLVQTETKSAHYEGRHWRLHDVDGAYNRNLPLHKLLPESLEELHIIQILDVLEFMLLCEKLCASLQSRTVPMSLEPHHFECLKEIKIEAPFEGEGECIFSELSRVTNQAGVKLTTIENSADYVKSWITGKSKPSCADKKIDWGFDGDVRWAHSLPSTLTSECTAALTVDVTVCDPLVRDLRLDIFYPPASLTRICTTGCSSALETWRSSVQSVCGNQTVTVDLEVETAAVYIPGALQYYFQHACLKDDGGRFCRPVAALAAVFSDPGISPFNYISNVTGQLLPDDCDTCLAERLRLREGSPYDDGPIAARMSLYKSMTASCGIAGRPVVPTTIGYFTAAPAPTAEVCEGSTYTIQASDDCYTISRSQGVGTNWLLADNNLEVFCTNFPAAGTSICITNQCTTVTVPVNATCEAVAAAANITEAQLIA